MFHEKPIRKFILRCFWPQVIQRAQGEIATRNLLPLSLLIQLINVDMGHFQLVQHSASFFTDIDFSIFFSRTNTRQETLSPHLLGATRCWQA